MRKEYRLISLAIVSSQVSCNETITTISAFFNSFLCAAVNGSRPSSTALNHSPSAFQPRVAGARALCAVDVDTTVALEVPDPLPAGAELRVERR